MCVPRPFGCLHRPCFCRCLKGQKVRHATCPHTMTPNTFCFPPHYIKGALLPAVSVNRSWAFQEITVFHHTVWLRIRAVWYNVKNLHPWHKWGVLGTLLHKYYTTHLHYRWFVKYERCWRSIFRNNHHPVQICILLLLLSCSHRFHTDKVKSSLAGMKSEHKWSLESAPGVNSNLHQMNLDTPGISQCERGHRGRAASEVPAQRCEWQPRRRAVSLNQTDWETNCCE